MLCLFFALNAILLLSMGEKKSGRQKWCMMAGRHRTKVERRRSRPALEFWKMKTLALQWSVLLPPFALYRNSVRFSMPESFFGLIGARRCDSSCSLLNFWCHSFVLWAYKCIMIVRILHVGCKFFVEHKNGPHAKKTRAQPPLPSDGRPGLAAGC